MKTCRIPNSAMPLIIVLKLLSTVIVIKYYILPTEGNCTHYINPNLNTTKFNSSVGDTLMGLTSTVEQN